VGNQEPHVTNATNIWSAEPPPRLIASRDTKTGVLRFPAFPADSPLATGQEVVALDGTGTVYSYSVIHPNPQSGAQPFALGYVDLPGPVRIFGRVEGDTLRIGAACTAVAHAEFGYVFQTIE
jgi:uncharacterized OB-fold protein